MAQILSAHGSPERIARRQRRLPGRLGMALLTLGSGLLALLSGIPVVLLFFVTAVPIWIASLVLLLAVGILPALVRSKRGPLQLLSAGLAWIGIAGLAVALSQSFAATPPIRGSDGQPVPGSIAALEAVELGGTQQWMTIRGHSTANPVLLFLAGGPGGSELVMTRRYLDDLEHHFVVVNWDQPGTGKSYAAADFATITPERFLADGLELTQYLRERFGKEKIYVFGESWGSILGVWMVQQQPDWYHALITTGQMVDPVENDQLGYAFAIEQLRAQGRTEAVEQLRRNGPPPYSQAEILGKFQAINGVLNDYMHAHAHGEGIDHNLFFDSLAAPEYGLLDKVNWIRGLAATFATVYPQLNDLDLRESAPRLEVPVYFIKGRWDVNAANSLAEDYFALLDAPQKHLIWFEDSAHTPMWDEPAQFIEVMVNTILPAAEPPAGTDAGFATYFDRQIPAYLREYNIAGALVAVVQDGAPLHLAGYGMADRAAQRTMDPQRSVVHVGSLGKTFTAVAAMQLVEQGQLDLDTDVNSYLDFAIPATYDQPITIRHLLTHTAGFEAHDIGAILVDPAALPTTRDYLLRNLPQRVRAPGEAVGYSNYGLALLGYIVERAAGRPLNDYLATAVIAPLDMEHTITEQIPPEQIAGDPAVGYEALQAQPMEYIAAFGAGPIRSTAADMAHYMIAMLDDGRYGAQHILQPATAQAMQARQFSAAAELNGTGFGFYELSRNGQRIVGHLGTTAYFHSQFLLFPEHNLGIFISFNSAEGAQVLRSPRFMDDLLNTFFPIAPVEPVPPADFAQHAADYRGTYFWNNLHGQSTIEKVSFLLDAVTIEPTEDNRLRMRSGGVSRTFVETAPDSFTRSDGRDRLVFHRDASGAVHAASLNSRAVFTLERQAWYEAPALSLSILIGSSLVFVIGLVANLVWLWGNRGADLVLPVAVGQWSAVLMPLLNLVFLLIFVLLLGSLLRGALPETALHLLLLLPALAAVLSLVLAGSVLLNWLQGEGTLLMRLHQSLLASAGILFALTLHIWNVPGWRI
jgi:CubicO group peptidase (beta-lactamase class C family)